MIHVQNLTKQYQIGKTTFTALDDISLEIQTGEFVSILGPSGSGKSTLMHLMGGLDQPSSGDVLVDGQNLAGLGDRGLAVFRNQKIGFVFQSFNLLPQISALHNVQLPLVYARGQHKRELLAQETLTKVGLETKTGNRPTELSGGEQQRLAIARAIINNPDIILADEPTGNLDTKTGKDILSLLVSLNKQGKTLVVVTHDESIARAAGRIIHLKDGRLV